MKEPAIADLCEWRETLQSAVALADKALRAARG